jgi:hypothetical protein
MLRYSAHSAQFFARLLPGPGGEGAFLVGEARAYGTKAWALRVSAGGSVLWENLYEEYDASHFTAMAPMPDGGFLAAGGAEPYSPNYRGEFQYGLARRFSADGRLLWERLYGGSKRVFGAAAPMPDGGAALAGTAYAPQAEAFLMRIDPEGEPLWIASGGGASFHGLCAQADGSILAVGDMQHGDPAERRACWARFGPDGARTDLKLSDLDGVSSFRAAAPRPGGGAFLGGTAAGEAQGTERALVIATDAEGRVEWRLIVGEAPADIGLRAMAAGDDGSVLLAGRHRGHAGAPESAWAAKAAPDGALLWQSAHGQGVSAHFADAAALPDKTAYFAGSIQEKEKAEAWLMHVDAKGRPLSAKPGP